jgi:hypothetical protein
MYKLKEISLFITLFFIQLQIFSYAGDMSQCNSISDYDQRQMCRAQASRNVSECGFIQNNDLRYMCSAQVGKRPSECGFIQNSNLKATCQATVK